jgi:hypothetical protein
LAHDDKTRELIVKKLDIRKYFEETEGVEQLSDLGGGQLLALCPFHADKNPSLSIGPTGVFYCHACKASGSVFDFYARKHLAHLMGSDAERKQAYVEARRVLGEMAGVSVAGGENLEPISPTDMAKWCEDLIKQKQMLTFLREERGLTDETITKWKLGWDGERITIPVFDLDGNLVNIRRYLPHAKGRKQKMIGYRQGYNKARLFPVKNLDKSEDIIFCEGEMDCIILNQEGFNALTVTSGAGTWSPEWTILFKGKRVIMCLDNDLAGREGTQRVAGILAKVASVYVVKWPSNLPEKGDVTDYFVNLGHTRDDFQQITVDAPLFEPVQEVKHKDDAPAIDVALQASTQAKFQGKRLRMTAFVNGKYMAPYVVPSTIEYTCGGKGDKSCDSCPSFTEGGKTMLKLGAVEQGVLGLFNVSDADQRRILKEAAGINTSCGAVKIEVKDQMNVEVLNLIPEIDTNVQGVDDDYVTRQVFSITHGIRTNRPYILEGYMWPNPKNQEATHLLDVVRPASDSLSEYSLTEEWRVELAKLFQPTTTIEAKLQDIYKDFEANVHRIRGRFNAQVAFDLVWHSVLAFYFNGAYVRKGWAEGLVLGDSGQGKSEMASGLLRHYRLGDRIQGEVTSGAGLVGGLEKIGEHWNLRWGKIPQNDRRLLVIDEFGGISEEEVAKMSDLRSTGIAEVVKIRIEKANARTRLIFMSNPREGMPLSAYDQGIQAVKRLFAKMEDVRRLDFALLVASGEVDSHLINQPAGEPFPNTYTSEACRQLVLWSWSVDPAAVKFTPEATKLILQAATEMGDMYSSKIPIVEPADQRLKLARLSVALACRTFSTSDGKEVQVTEDHVAYVVQWLNSIYSNQYMAYHEYSRYQKELDKELDADAKDEVIKVLAKLPLVVELIDHLASQSYAFKKPDLQDQVGYDNDQVRLVLKTLSSHKLIKTTARGYNKQPQFIRLIRELVTPTGQAKLKQMIATPTKVEEADF